jgi:hypothetical protein
MKHIAYPSTGQFKDCIQSVNRSQYKGQTLTFKGTVKLHGTNVAIAYNNQDGLWVQSRNNIITPQDDLYGFAFYVKSHEEHFSRVIEHIASVQKINLDNNTLVVYGEWAGEGIQRGVGISAIEKSFFIFAAKVAPRDEALANHWFELTRWDYAWPPKRTYYITRFTRYEADIDFSRPEEIQNGLRILTEGVEQECPVASKLGHSGIGEGIVWSHICPDGSRFAFKVRGEKHSSSKVKTLAPIDEEKLASKKAFIEYAVTEQRLEQGIDEVFTQKGVEPAIEQTGDFLRWIVNDIVKEELQAMICNNIEPKQINGDISKHARTWFMKRIGAA